MADGDPPRGRRLPKRGELCHVCGQVHERCAGHINGRPCRKWATKGLEVCPRHGGGTRLAIAAGERRLKLVKEEQNAREALTILDLRHLQDVNPAEELLRSVATAAHVQAHIRGRMTDPVTSACPACHTELEIPRDDEVLLELLERWTRLTGQVSKLALDAGVAERQVRLAEQQGALLAGVIRRVLGDLRLTPEQEELVPAIVRRHLLEAASS